MLEQLNTVVAKGLECKSEVLRETSIKNLHEPSPIRVSLGEIENTSLESLKARNEASLADIGAGRIQIAETSVGALFENRGLTEEDIERVKGETCWSDEIVRRIRSLKEYEVYNNVGLREIGINGKKCLVRGDIAWDREDSMGRTNIERAREGLSPINVDGESIELHHIGQKSDGPLAELTRDEHRGRDNFSLLHDSGIETEIDRGIFNRERNEHWKERERVRIGA